MFFDILILSRFSEEKMFSMSNTRNQSVSIFRKPIWFRYKLERKICKVVELTLVLFS